MTMQNVTPAAGSRKRTPKTPEQKAAKAAKKAELKQAIVAIAQFSQTEDFGKLPKGIQAAISLLTSKPSRAASGNAGAAQLSVLRGLFPKVGAKVTELEMFKQTKKGRAEIKKLVRVALRKCAPADRMWIAFDDKSETWTLVATGETAPKDWAGYNPNADNSPAPAEGEDGE